MSPFVEVEPQSKEKQHAVDDSIFISIMEETELLQKAKGLAGDHNETPFSYPFGFLPEVGNHDGLDYDAMDLNLLERMSSVTEKIQEASYENKELTKHIDRMLEILREVTDGVNERADRELSDEESLSS